MMIFTGKTLVFEIWPNFWFRGASKRDFSSFGRFFSFPVYFGAMVIRDALVMRKEGDPLEKTICRYLFSILRKIQKSRF